MANSDQKRARRRRKPVDPDRLQQRALALLENVIEDAETKPETMVARGGVETVIKVSEFLRKLNSDLNSTLDVRALSRLSDADLDAIEAQAKKGKR